MGRVSVVIPAYNAEQTLCQALDSVLVQSVPASEIIVVDDGSSDETANLAEAYGGRVSCIRKDHGGVSAARNVGIEASTGELVALLDADDLWMPDKLERQLSLMVSSGAGAVYSWERRMDEQGRVLGETRKTRYIDYCEALLLYSCIAGSCSSFLIHRELLRAVGGFDPQLSHCEDWKVWLKLSLRTQFAFVEAPLVSCRQPSANLSDLSAFEFSTFAVLDEFYSHDYSQPYHRIRPLAYSNQWMILAGSYFRSGSLEEAVRCGARSVSLSPRNLRRALGLPMRRLRGLLG